MNEFTKARLKLTGWYILISLSMLIIFTFAAITAERRAFNRIEQALGDPVQRPRLTFLLERSLVQFHGDFQQRLFIFDIILLLGSAGASWLLSGRTLKPIQEMVEAQTEFAADASHELRTPLSTIGMEIEALERTQKQLPSHTKNTLDSIRQEVKRMGHLVDGLLTLVRSEDQKPSWKTVHLAELVNDAFQQMKPLAQEKKVNVILEGVKRPIESNRDAIASLQHDRVIVKGNPDQLKQVLIILLDNAIQYTHKGGKVTLSLLRTHHSPVRRSLGEGGALITVSDSGPGISETDLPHIFDRFYRAHQEQKLVSSSSERGAGLGLAIAKKIIDSHHGQIKVKSALGEGSTFTIYLPLKEV